MLNSCGRRRKRILWISAISNFELLAVLLLSPQEELTTSSDKCQSPLISTFLRRKTLSRGLFPICNIVLASRRFLLQF